MSQELERSEVRQSILTHVDHFEYPRLIVVHGPHGIGKRWLLDNLESDLKVRDNVIVIREDWQTSYLDKPQDAMIDLRMRIAAAAKDKGAIFRAEFFDLAAYQYKRKLYGKAKASAQATDFKALSASFGSTIFRTLLTSSLGLAASVAMAHGPLALAAGPVAEWCRKQILKSLDKQFEKRVEKFASYIGVLNAKSQLNPERKTELLNSLQALSKQSPTAIAASLPRFLADDIKLYLITNQPVRLVILSSRHQPFWGNETEQKMRTAFPLDNAIDTLIASRSDALFVMADACLSRWDRLARKIEVKFIELEPLSDAASHELLASFGIANRDLQRAISAATFGHPFWLEKIALRLRDQPDGNQEFNGLVEEELLNVLSARLTHSEIQTLKQLSTTLIYDEPLFRVLIGGPFQTGYPLAAGAKEFAKLSFVEDRGTGQYSIVDDLRLPIANWMWTNEEPLVRELEALKVAHWAARGIIGHVLLTADRVASASSRMWMAFHQATPERIHEKADRVMEDWPASRALIDEARKQMGPPPDAA
ncbi:hypothetical protein [Paraburkholderia sp. ZP32-5]|uniref:hypothetical protein n=1 Tax=Paraburkholderia sp. ZP32-5 TaxID=2883245 RepID=UPI001F1A7E73|nr:hypothetical protein [Paraburkholderia sp. ZP32-5]